MVGDCGMCGPNGDGSCLDHCHRTGLARGWLCHSCNIGEAFASDEVGSRWHHWRRHAPMLAVGARYVHLPGVIPANDPRLLTEPMDDLLELADSIESARLEWVRQQRAAAGLPSAADVIGRALSRAEATS
jgi:hypothetical protein